MPSHQPWSDWHAQTKALGGTLYLVHVRTDVTSDRAVAHAKEYGLTMPLLLDHEHVLVDHLNATVTPEGVVLVRDGDRWLQMYQGGVNKLVCIAWESPRLGLLSIGLAMPLQRPRWVSLSRRSIARHWGATSSICLDRAVVHHVVRSC